MVLVPAFLQINGVVFPLAADARGVHLVTDEPELNALDLVVMTMIVDRQGADRTAELRARDYFSPQQRSASPVTSATPLGELGDGPINWKRLAGAWPDRSDAYLIQAAGIERMLVVPAATLIALVDQLGALYDDVLAGRREPKVDPAMAVPPRPPPAPDVVEHERLRPLGEIAQEFLEQVLALPTGQQWTLPPPEPNDGSTDDGSAAQADDAAAPVAIARLPDRSSPPALASAEILREIEQAARALDELDARARQGTEPYADEALDAQVVAKRRRLLIELDVAGVLAPSLGDRVRARLIALEVPIVRGYHDAALAMHAYFASGARARLVHKPAPARVIDADISLDWFRQPSGYRPSTCTADDWLALCERNFEEPPALRAGKLFVKLEGAFHQLWFRSELGTTPRLWRALPA